VAPGSDEEAALRACCNSLRGWGAPFQQLVASPEFSIRQLEGERVEFSDGTITVAVPHASVEEGWVEQLPDSFVRGLVQLAFCVVAGEPVLLVGDTCYKSSLVRAWADITGGADEQQTVHLHPGDARLLLAQ
jgi:hypothetical protein